MQTQAHDLQHYNPLMTRHKEESKGQKRRKKAGYTNLTSRIRWKLSTRGFPNGKLLQQKCKLHFYSNYFKSTVGEIAMKLCYFNSFQHFQILLRVIDKCSKVEISLRRRGRKNVVQTCFSTWIFLSKIYFWQPNSHEVEANPMGQNQLSCHLAHSFGSLCFPGCSWKDAVQRKCLLLVSGAFPFQSIGGHTETNTIDVLWHVLTSHSGVTE